MAMNDFCIMNRLRFMDIDKNKVIITGESALVMHGVLEKITKNEPDLIHSGDKEFDELIVDSCITNKRGYKIVKLEKLLNYYRYMDNVLYEKIVTFIKKQDDRYLNLCIKRDGLEHILKFMDISIADRFIYEHELYEIKNELDLLSNKSK